MNPHVAIFILVGGAVLIGIVGGWLSYQLKWKPLLKSLEKFLNERKA